MNYCSICKSYNPSLETCYKKHGNGKRNRIGWCRICNIFFKKVKHQRGDICRSCSWSNEKFKCEAKIIVHPISCSICNKNFTLHQNRSCYNRCILDKLDKFSYFYTKDNHKLYFNTSETYTRQCRGFLDNGRKHPTVRICGDPHCPGKLKNRFFSFLWSVKQLNITLPLEMKKLLLTYFMKSTIDF